MMKELRKKGMSITDISKKMGISRPTVRKYLGEEKYSGYSREGRLVVLQVEQEEERVDKDACGNRRRFHECCVIINN